MRVRKAARSAGDAPVVGQPQVVVDAVGLEVVVAFMKSTPLVHEVDARRQGG